MIPSSTQGRRILAELMQAHTGAPVAEADMQMVAEGASGRCIMRAQVPACRGIIGIYWTPDRADNASFLPAAHGLSRAGVPVPAVLAEQDCGCGCGACLVQDLGHTSLLTLRQAPPEQRLAAYRSALQALHRFHQVQPDWELQPPFDAELYLWEQRYFAEHFLGRHLGHAEPLKLIPQAVGSAMADFLAGLPRTPVHRDCQSQNILLLEDKVHFIDFQGMRMGRPEYDLASLLWDPYMDMADAERHELLDYYSSLSGSRPEQEVLVACALQRIMQALGAFANIGHNMHNPWYLSLIPTGVRTLHSLMRTAPPHTPAAQLALCLSSLGISSS